MSAEKSMGTTLTIGEDVIADLNSIGEVGIESSEIETTTLDSPDGYREFIASLKDGGELAFAGTVKSEANMEDLLELADTQTVEECVITFPSGSTWAFDAFVKSFKEGASEIESVRTFSGSLRISGKPVYTSGTPSV